MTTLAVLIAAIWGIAFTVIHIGLQQTEPLMLTALRFAFAALPLVFVIRPPKAPIGVIVAYGLVQGGLMFGTIFTAMAIGMPAGLASLIAQCQMFFTIALAAIFDGERPSRMQLAGAAVAAFGVAVIAYARGFVEGVPMLPLLLTLLGAFFWAVANIISRRARGSNPVRLIVWSSLAAPPVLLILSALLEPGAYASLVPPSWTLVWVVAFLALPTTVLAFGLWVYLLREHEAAVVTPFSLLVPVFGFAAAALFLGERWSFGVSLGSVLVFAGLVITVAAHRPRAA